MCNMLKTPKNQILYPHFGKPHFLKFATLSRDRNWHISKLTTHRRAPYQPHAKNNHKRNYGGMSYTHPLGTNFRNGDFQRFGYFARWRGDPLHKMVGKKGLKWRCLPTKSSGLSSLLLVPFEETICPLVIQPSELEDRQFYCRQIIIFIIKLNWPSIPTRGYGDVRGIP